jgi:hypothetical protein
MDPDTSTFSTNTDFHSTSLSHLHTTNHLELFLKSVPQLATESSLHRYYMDYDGPEFKRPSDSAMINFWKDTLNVYQRQVTRSFRIRIDRVVQDFTLHHRVPHCIPNIVKFEMTSQLVPEQEFFKERESND